MGWSRATGVMEASSTGSVMVPTILSITGMEGKDAVIVDLKGPLLSAHESLTKPREALPPARIGDDASIASKSNVINPPPDEDEENDVDDDEDGDDYPPKTKPNKISERKRRLKAIADSYVLSKQLREVKLGVKANLKREEQSARWMINEIENRQIISSPRDYQLELFERAKEQNVIAVLDTGSGKTLIAVLLLRHVFAQELEDRAIGKPKRFAFFLVDSVALMFQQHAVLKANLDQPMEMCCGDMGCDSWSREVCEKLFQENMTIVCTAEILRCWLHHSFISMNRINLLIFDEAHHAKKDHPYARIILDFYAKVPEGTLRPKVFGMTASPVDAKTDVRKAAAELEAMLHCEIATPKDKKSLSGYKVSVHQEQMAVYSTLGAPFRTALFKDLHIRLAKNSIFRKPLLFAYEASRELGAWCSDHLWQLCLSDEEQKRLRAKTERQHHSRKAPEPLAILEEHTRQLDDAWNVVKSHEFEDPDYKDDRKSSKNLSSKVVVLIKYLRERFERPTDDKCIVFVTQRYTARLLSHLFAHPNIKTPFLHAGILIGTQAGGFNDMNTSFREQVITMVKFRKGEINCLFATSVAEEGLDIPDCNLVVRFDLYRTLIQYIQSKGRARHANSRYIHMLEDLNQDHVNIVKEVRIAENTLESFCDALPESRKLLGNDYGMDYFLAKEKMHRTYTVPETGAKLTYKISLLVLASFVDSLPRTPENSASVDYVVTSQNQRFVCEALLPVGSPIRGAVGMPATTKQVAKCSAAFETCLLLRQGGYLDQYLLPIFTKQLPAMRNALLAVDSKKRESYDMKTKPMSWSMSGVPEELFLTILSLQNPESLGRLSQPLGLLTRTSVSQLPPFILHFGGGNNSPVVCTSISRPVKLSAPALRHIHSFTLCVFYDIFSKQYHADIGEMPYFLAPIKLEHGLDNKAELDDPISWEVLKNIDLYHARVYANPFQKDDWQTLSDEALKQKFIVDPFDGSRKLWSVGVAPQYKPLDPVPPNTAPRKGTRKNNDNILEYSCSLFASARSRRTFDNTQRVFEAEYISLRRNLLDEFDGPVEESPKTCFIVLEPLRISPLPAPVVAMTYLLPAIIHRIESYLIALEACDLLDLRIRPDLALEAVTKDSDNTGDHGVEQINFQRGMGNNYERLEFIGDCFLKMATSISLFGLHPGNDEYQYHVDRMVMICNKNLRNNALKLRLYEYIRSQSFNRRAWYPEGLKIVSGKTATAPKTHKLGDKSIADVSEALIGAALLSHFDTKNMDDAVRAVTALVSNENHQARCWADYYKMYKKPTYQVAPETAAQRDLARQIEQKHSYHFKYPRLLRSAFVHPSYPFSYEKIPSYQRLEFLGDSLLDMACVNYLFHKFPQRDPQWLTEHKMAMVSNQFLGALCVSLGLQTHLLLFNSSFQNQVSSYVADVTEARLQAEEEAVRAGKSKQDCSPDYWTTVRQPPKCLPDIVEALIGAIFVDSEYNFTEVERFFDEHIKWYFLDMTVYDTFANRHPTTFLTHFLQESMGCSDWSVISREIKNVDGSKPKIMAMVFVHEKVVSDATLDSGRYAKIAAAKKALEKLEGLPRTEFRAEYGCACHEGEELVGDGEVQREEVHGSAV